MIRAISGKTVKDIQEDGHTDVASMQQKVLVGMKAMMTLQQELSKLPDGGNLPTWWTNKIAIAVDKLDGLSDYLDTKVESVNESTAAYKKSLEQIAKDRQLKNLTKKDRDTLVKIAKLLDQEKKEDLDETDTVAGDIALKDMPLGKKKDDEEEVNEAKVGDTVSFKWPSSISMNVPQKNRKPGGFVKGILTKVDRTRAKVKIGNKVYSVSTSDLMKEMKEEVLVEADSLYLIYKDKMKAKKVAAHIKARHKKFDVNLAPMDAKNMGITVFGKGAEKVKADVTKKYGKPDDFMMEDFSDTSIEEV